MYQFSDRMLSLSEKCIAYTGPLIKYVCREGSAQNLALACQAVLAKN